MRKRMFSFVFAALLAVWVLPLAVAAQGTGRGSYGEQIDHNTLTYRLYAYLKPLVQQVAAGELSSTVFTPDIATLGLTGVTEAEISEATNTALWLLLEDCPYEMYWFDKPQGFVWQGRTLNDKYTEMTLSYAVLAEYRGADEYHTDPAKARATAAATARAAAIVAENATKTDYEKLAAYRDAICTMTDYDFPAYERGGDDNYGVSWQIIPVFDDDPATKVVCEGYAKAFQYLCNLSTFRREITCTCVSGVMAGATGSGNHMWNIVTINGENYLADITGSDEGSAGQEGELFLAGAAGSPTDGYYFSAGNTTVAYAYDADTLRLFDAALLSLAPAAYTPPAPGDEPPLPTPSPTPTPAPTPAPAQSQTAAADPTPAAQAEAAPDTQDDRAAREEAQDEAPRRGDGPGALAVVVVVVLVLLLVAGLAVAFVFVLKKLD